MVDNSTTKRSVNVSVVVPTLNSEKTLGQCLHSIHRQEYDGEFEIVVADGGSTDQTISIAREYDSLIVNNPLMTGEAGKAVGTREASGEIIAFIDSDNILPDRQWLSRMMTPFDDPAIAGSEPLRFEYRRHDSPLTRYCALIGMNDPLCLFLKNYDRFSTLTGLWTGLSIDSIDRGGFLEIHLKPDTLPTMGANGFLVRKRLLDLLDFGEYLFDIDVVYELVMLGHNHFAKVDVGIVHMYGTGITTLARKQLRRARDFHYYRDKGMRSYPWSMHKKLGVVRFVVYCLLILPLLLQTLKGFAKKPDPAWFLHAPSCLVTLMVYTFGVIESVVRPRMQQRTHWRQR